MTNKKKLSTRESRALLEWRVQYLKDMLKATNADGDKVTEQLNIEREHFLALSKRIVELHDEIDKLRKTVVSKERITNET